MGAQVAKNGAKEETAAEKSNGQVTNTQGKNKNKTLVCTNM